MKEQNKITEHLHARTFAHLNPCTHARLHTYTHTRLHALTLIELVIVCAIIAVLVGIVWVVMAPTRERARQVVCISNLNLIGHAFRMYRDDWDGVEPQKGVRLEYWQVGLPPRKSSPNPCLTPYLKTRTVWICPSEFYPTFLKTSSYLPNVPTKMCIYSVINMMNVYWHLVELFPLVGQFLIFQIGLFLFVKHIIGFRILIYIGLICF